MTMTVRESTLDPAPQRSPEPIPAEPMTWEQWLAFDPDNDTRYELVQGVPVMTRPKSALNAWAAERLTQQLAAAGIEFRWLRHGGIEIQRDPKPTGREADLLVVRKESLRDTSYFSGDEVVLAVECVSAGSSDERDWVTKREEYARVGVNAYLVVDRVRGQLVLFDRIVDGMYSRRQDADPEVTLELGEHRIAVRLDQLLE
ncbi:Uma2 family endonuclease [Kineosphaera limosa]|uniref:Putative restriction endonuclease domain-containing protein n=1 Tax=Kineosphaera limosa NBRC 100340 TaxID=1184609 RepID=K6VJN5_9MICO|nr:Uma2 family endonuclease [Kineosphaera limosa]NYE01774.1 Uma2 family endonuclease [Kineosphaera limosa]GAB96428.1 hypothetical protein KILIM_039_00020 [Kineosphaera limosa NBRC 100340]